MTNATIALGIGLVALGVIAYLATGRESVTALIPAVLGLPILLLGLLATREAMRRHAVHAALVLALIGIVGTLPQVMSFPALVAGEEVDRPAAVATSTITFVACLAYVIAGVRSFIAARRERSASTS